MRLFIFCGIIKGLVFVCYLVGGGRLLFVTASSVMVVLIIVGGVVVVIIVGGFVVVRIVDGVVDGVADGAVVGFGSILVLRRFFATSVVIMVVVTIVGEFVVVGFVDRVVIVRIVDGDVDGFVVRVVVGSGSALVLRRLFATSVVIMVVVRIVGEFVVVGFVDRVVIVRIVDGDVYGFVVRVVVGSGSVFVVFRGSLVIVFVCGGGRLVHRVCSVRLRLCLFVETWDSSSFYLFVHR